jgi:dUTP pyrophosphatase
MQVKVKKLNPNAIIPSYAKNGDAGLDLTAISVSYQKNYDEYDTGLAFEIPNGYVGLIFPRSSITKKDIILKNSVGVIDSGFRDSIKFRFTKDYNTYQVGDRIGQIIILPYPKIELVESDELSETERGLNGYGSTGK